MTPNFVTATLDRLRRTADRVSFLGPSLARLTVGLVFIGTGWGKLHSIPDVTDFFISPAHPGAGLQRPADRGDRVLRRLPGNPARPGGPASWRCRWGSRW